MLQTVTADRNPEFPDILKYINPICFALDFVVAIQIGTSNGRNRSNFYRTIIACRYPAYS